jgi:hypothetical protein
MVSGASQSSSGAQTTPPTRALRGRVMPTVRLPVAPYTARVEEWKHY